MKKERNILYTRRENEFIGQDKLVCPKCGIALTLIWSQSREKAVVIGHAVYNTDFCERERSWEVDSIDYLGSLERWYTCPGCKFKISQDGSLGKRIKRRLRGDEDE